MKIFVKTLKGTNFEIQVQPDDTVADVKKNIETVQGADVYPAQQLMLIHQGKVLKDAATLAENSVAENSFIVVMLSKTKPVAVGASSASPAPSSQAQPQTVTTPAAAPTSTPTQAQPQATTEPAVVRGPPFSTP